MDKELSKMAVELAKKVHPELSAQIDRIMQNDNELKDKLIEIHKLLEEKT